mgnify:CR=1 FL=1
MNIIDISKPLLTTVEYPGDPETRLDTVRSIEKGDECNLSAVYACVHTATPAISLTAARQSRTLTSINISVSVRSLKFRREL